MPGYVIVGTVGAGKSTLFNALRGIKKEAEKTQSVEYDSSGGIDTPGEFLCFPHLLPALLSTTTESCTILYVHAADDMECHLPDGIFAVYPHCRVAVVITKIDLPQASPDLVEEMLRSHGLAGPIFRVGKNVQDDFMTLKSWLYEDALP